jgi:hypothetical protein
MSCMQLQICGGYWEERVGVVESCD